MPSTFATGKRAIAICDRCGFQYKLKELKEERVNLAATGNLVCPSCWEEDHPQWQTGRYPVLEAEGLRNPRTDTTYSESRDIQWGWRPVGFKDNVGLPGLNNRLEATASVGTVTVTLT